MTGGTTTNYGYYVPGVDEDGWGPPVSQNFFDIDTDIAAAAVSAGSGTPEFTMSAASAGATSITLSSAPAANSASYNVFALGVGKATCELVAFALPGTATITTNPLRHAHTAGETVYQLGDEVCPLWYGAAGNGTTDDWTALMRCHIDAQIMGLRINGYGRTYATGQPLTFADSSIPQLHITHTSGYGPIATPTATSYTYNAIMPICVEYMPFTAAGSTITIPGLSGNTASYADDNDWVVQFNNPLGASFPSGITAGVPYFVVSGNDGAKTIQISSVADGSPITVGTGGGYAAIGVFQLSRAYWDDVRADISANNISGFLVNQQQDGYIRKMRIDQNAVSGSVGARIGGQWNVLDYFSGGDPGLGSTCLYLTGTGHDIKSIVIQGPGLHIGMFANFVNIGHFWTEDSGATATSINIQGATRGLTVGNVYMAGISKFLDVDTTDTSYSVDLVRNGGTGGVLVDATGAGAGSLSIGTDTTEEGDNQGVVKGLTKGVGEPLRIESRVSRTVTAPYTVRLSDHTVFATPSGSNPITLPWAGWTDMPFRVKNLSGSTALPIAVNSGETIDGASASGYTIAAGVTKAFVKDGASNNWRTV